MEHYCQVQLLSHFEMKLSLNRGENGVCVLTARGLDMRSNDCRMRLAVALVTPQG